MNEIILRVKDLIAEIESKEEELKSLRRINRTLMEVIEKQAIKVTIRDINS